MLKLNRILFLLLLSSSITAQIPVIWDYTTGVTVDNNGVTKTLSNNSNEKAGVLSGNVLSSMDNGWAQFKVYSLNQRLFFGLIKDNTLNKYYNAELNTYSNEIYNSAGFYFSVELGTNNKLKIYINGKQQGQYGNYAVNDIIRIERTNNKISVKKNAIVLGQFSINNSSDLRVISTIQTSGGTLANPACSFIKPITVVSGVKEAFCNSLEKGNLSLSVSGGNPPYNIIWQDGSKIFERHDLFPGTYSYTITDANRAQKSSQIDLLSCVRWENPVNLTVNNGQITKTSSNGWGNSGANSLNTLGANNNGYVSYKINSTANLAFGLDLLDSLKTVSYASIYFNYLILNNNLYITNNGTIVAKIGRIRIGDNLRINKNGDKIEYLKNGIILFTQGLEGFANQDLNVEAALYYSGQIINGIKASFFKPRLQANVNKNAINEPNSGFISLTGQNGLPPYQYLWSNGTKEPYLFDLNAGDYSVTITDSLHDTLRVKIPLGKRLSTDGLVNISLQEQQMSLVDDTKSGLLSLQQYIKPFESGWYELTVRETNSSFNFLLRDNGAIIPPSMCLPESPIVTIVETKTVTLNGQEIPDIRSNEFQNLNKVRDITYTIQPQTLDVIVHSYFDENCPVEKRQIINSSSGIFVDNNRLYFLVNGTTYNKSISISNNDVLRLGIEKDLVYLEVNGNRMYSGTNAAKTEISADIVLITRSAAISEIINNVSSIRSAMSSFCEGDLAINWDYNKIFDEWGNIVSETKAYYDNMGRPSQSQVKNISKNTILASQIIYDNLGRGVITTLPAPINQTQFCFKSNFITNQSGAQYGVNDFDKVNTPSANMGEIDNPAPVNASLPGTLGWYYSNNNSMEKFVATASTPYNRMQYSQSIPDNVLKVSKPGTNLKHGSGHEEYSYEVNSSGELGYVYGFLSSWNITDMTSHFNNYAPCKDVNDVKSLFIPSYGISSTKKITVDANGVETVGFYDLRGNLLVTCLAGQVNDANQNLIGVKNYIDVDPATQTGYTDVHLPKGTENTLVLDFGPTGSCIYNIINLKTEEYVKMNNTINIGQFDFNSSLTPGCYRIILKTVGTSGFSSIPVAYSLNYYNFTVNYYDLAGRLKLSVPPKGFDYNYGNSTSDPITNLPVTNNTVAKKFGLINGTNVSTYSGVDELIQPNWQILNNGSSTNKTIDMSITGSSGSALTQLIGALVSFSGKSSGYAPVFGSDNGTTSGERTIPNNNIIADDSYAKSIYYLDSADFANSPPDLSFDSAGARVISSSGPNNVVCNYTIVPIQITYILKDFFSQPISGVEKITGYCTIKKCSDGSYAKSWSFPPPKKYFTTPQVSNMYTLRLEIVSINFVKTPYTPVFSTNLIGDITACLSGSLMFKTTTPLHNMTEVYDYDSFGQLNISKTPDAGKMANIYSEDGKVRFTQNSKQNLVSAAPGFPSQLGTKFSYVNYDEMDRPIESGEYNSAYATGSSVTKVQFQDFYQYFDEPVPNTVSVKTLAFNEQNVDDAIRTTDKIFIVYDKPDLNFGALTGLNTVSYKQNYLLDEISYSYNENRKTWYSYDDQGKLSWVVQRYENIGGPSGFKIKTYNYRYDFLGNLLEVIYQKEVPSERLSHLFEYDADKRLKKVYSSRNGVLKHLDAEYSYYLHGPLKRMEIGNNLQGVDFVYTVNGWLKNINSPEKDAVHDPGRDGNLANGKISYPDIFGMSLDYFDKDYERAGSYVQSYSEPQSSLTNYALDLYNGITKAQRWQIKTPTGGVGLMAYQNQHLMYGYKYDKKYQLTDANFGTVDYNGVQNYPAGENIANDQPLSPVVTFGNDYKVSNLNYDYNGNILSLNRNAYTAGIGGLQMDNLTYSYYSCSNKLNNVADANISTAYNSFGFKPGQGATNYQQNVLGELTQDLNDGKNYEYNSWGLIKRITDNSGNPIVEYEYNEAQQRYLKRAYSGNSILNTFYVRDAGGNISAVYEKTQLINNPSQSNYNIKEWNIMNGGYRIGSIASNAGAEEYSYQLNDHLGNVRTTFKEGLKTTISDSFESSDQDSIYFYETSHTKVNSGGNTVDRIYAPTRSAGVSTYLIPVKAGDIVNATIDAFYQGTLPPNSAYLAVDFTDQYGNALDLTDQINLSKKSYVTSSSLNMFSPVNVSYQVPNNAFPMVFAKVYIYNPSTTSVDFDNLQINFSGSGSGVKVPTQLDAYSYYPHGSLIPGLNYNGINTGRYTYQGQYAENDKEINEQFFELRNYNPLLGRFQTTDAYHQFHSPYLGMANSPNGVDPDGGNLLSFGIGAAGGAVVGGLIGWGYSKNMGQTKAGQIESSLWGAGIGAIIGGTTLGLLTDANWKWGGYAGARHRTGFRFSSRKSGIIPRLHGPGLDYGKSKTPHTGMGGFAFGFRFGNVVYLDIRFNYHGHDSWKSNFPGRIWLWESSHYRFSLLPYRVWPGGRHSSSHYPAWEKTGDTQGHIFIGGYKDFYECFDWNGTSHYKKGK